MNGDMKVIVEFVHRNKKEEQSIFGTYLSKDGTTLGKVDDLLIFNSYSEAKNYVLYYDREIKPKEIKKSDYYSYVFYSIGVNEIARLLLLDERLKYLTPQGDFMFEEFVSSL